MNWNGGNVATNNYVAVVNALCQQYGLPKPKPEHRFASPRRWCLDFAFLRDKVALEVEGGIWIRGGGRHNRGAGMLKDMEKYNRAAALGWRVVRCTPQTLISGVEAVAACLTERQ
jgi:very-short-patch-repair endonuclease